MRTFVLVACCTSHNALKCTCNGSRFCECFSKVIPSETMSLWGVSKFSAFPSVFTSSTTTPTPLKGIRPNLCATLLSGGQVWPSGRSDSKHKMDASEVHHQKINAKEVLTPQRRNTFIFPAADGTAKLSGRDHESREPTLRRDQTRRE